MVRYETLVSGRLGWVCLYSIKQYGAAHSCHRFQWAQPCVVIPGRAVPLPDLEGEDADCDPAGIADERPQPAMVLDSDCLRIGRAVIRERNRAYVARPQGI